MASPRIPETRYAKSRDGVDLAYKVVGDGPVDVLWSFSQLSDVEAIWEYPPISSFLGVLAGAYRLVVHDRRGLGRSGGERLDLETDVADLLTLLDAVDSERAYLVGAVIGGAIYAALAKAHPDRVAGLVWHGAFARSAWAPDYPWGATSEELEDYATKLADGWGTEPFAAAFVAGGAPSMAGDEESVQFFARWMRQTSDARTAGAYNRLWDTIDLSQMLADVRVPTLLTSRGADPGEAAHVASLIPGARLVTFEGEDFMPFYEAAPVLDAIREFVDRTTAVE